MKGSVMSRRQPRTNRFMAAHDEPSGHRPSSVDLPSARSREDACLDCGWPDIDAQVVSRHRTSQGTIVWTRCICGVLQVWLHRPGATEAVARASQPVGRWDGAS